MAARANIVLTLTGKDRVGIVEEVTRVMLELGGNVETSRMARLGGEFSILMLVSLPKEQVDQIQTKVEALKNQGYKVTTSETPQTHAERHPGWLPYKIQVLGADHEGVVHEIAHYLSEHGINIESMETQTSQAPFGGTPLFSMSALIAVPPDVAPKNWVEELIRIGQELNVDVNVAEVSLGT